ncbi:MAG TPA: peptidyl-tRNA hydrolase [Thermoprotei archaeon]|nr:peptidyl-tRNA hydrolase [Thermoprotei archaeon]
MFKYKQIIIVRRDIKMSVGKIAAQVAHAAVSAAEIVRKTKRKWYGEWIKEGQRKIVLEVNDLNELLEIYDLVKKKGLPAVLIKDMGLTELPPNTITTIGIGPVPENLIDPITRKLRLLK